MFVLPQGQHRFTEIAVLDAPGAGGAYHKYQIRKVRSDDDPVFGALRIFTEVIFQNGPVKETDVNGIFIEDLLEICRHRLQCFQAADFACRENEHALTKIEEALHWLNSRTADRQRRGVEGKSEK
jgi:hypothetical protein